MSKTNDTGNPLKAYKARWQQMELLVPPGFNLLCTLLEKKPQEVLTHFMQAVAAEVPYNNRLLHTFARDYLTACGYHQPFYTDAELAQLFAEAQSMALLRPGTAPAAVLQMHDQWQAKYYRWWVKKWKGRKKPKPANP